MKKLQYLILVSLIFTAFVNMRGATVDFYLYFYSGSANINGDVGQFTTTSTSGVYLLENVTVSANVNFCVHNNSWSTQYGWKSAGVTSVGTDVELASASSATGWLAIPSGTYDVTFNSNTLTIRFDTHSTASTSLVYRSGNTFYWTADDSEVRLFGANYCLPSACDYRAAGYVGMTTLAQKKSMIDEDLDHFVRLGFDAIRLSFYGDYENTNSSGNLQDNDHLDLLCYLIQQASARGIYMMLTPIIGFDSRWPESDFSSSVDASGTGMARSSSFSGKWQYIYSTETPYTWANTYISELLAYTNPYTNVQLKDEPNILFIEVINEPAYSSDLITYKSNLTSEYQTAINGYVSTIRATGCQKPVIFNVSQDIHASDIINGSNADGGSYSWYPTLIQHHYTINNNALLHTDRYSQMLDQTNYPFSKPKVVYEFDTSDLCDGYTYPAMAREFRRGGVQFAALYDYDMLRTAPYNNANRTHYFNMVYTPQKAVSAMIAAEVMRQVSAGTTNAYYPANNSFGDFRLSYDEKLAVLNDGTHYYYSNNTTDAPKNASTIEHIAGYGSSPVVDYQGTGIYFLDKVNSTTWTLEVYPDITEVSDPFTELSSMTAITSPSVVHKSACNTHNIYINLPSLQSSFAVSPGIYTIVNGAITGSSNLPAQSFYAGFASTTEPTATVTQGTETDPSATITLTTATGDEWTRCYFSRSDYHCPSSTLSIDWNSFTSKKYYNYTVTSLATSSDYTNYGNYPDATLSIYVGDRLTDAFTPQSFIINAKYSNSLTSKALFLVVDSDGKAWGKELTLSGSYRDITVNVSDLTPYKAAMLPQDWPGINSYWYPASVSNTDAYSTIDWSKVEYVQLSMRNELYSSNLNSERGFSLDYIKASGTRAVTIDENETASPDMIPAFYNFTLKRTLVRNMWNPICLPVYLDQNAINWYFGEGTQVAQFTGVASGTGTDAIENCDVLQFTTTNYIDYNKPYLICPTSTAFGQLNASSGAPATNRSKSISTDGGQSTIAIDNIWTVPFSPVEVTQDDYTFVGASAVRDAHQNTYTANDEGYLSPDASATGTETIKATEAYVITPAGTDNTTGLNFSVDGTIVTGIVNLNVVKPRNDNQRIYNLNGSFVGNSLDLLPPGIYIRNNEKILKK